MRGEKDPEHLLVTAASALAEANAEVGRSRAAERRLESIVVGVMQHVPVPMIVVDEELSVRACSDAARTQGIRPGLPLSPAIAAPARQALASLQAARPTPIEADGWHLSALDGGTPEARLLLWRYP
jgi:hypothetical protein